MLLSVSAVAPQSPPVSYKPNLLLFPIYNNCTKNLQPKQSNSSFKQLNASSSLSTTNNTSDVLHHVTRTLAEDEPPGGGDAAAMVSSASAVASAIRGASTSPVEFLQMIEKNPKTKLVLPSPDFQRLCLEQLDLFRRIVDPDAVLSVYVRPAGSYVMDRLELRRVTCYPDVNTTDIIIVIGNFSVPTGLRAAEAALSSQQVEVVPEYRAVVFPMVKHPFVVGFLVAELPVTGQGADNEGRNFISYPSPEEAYALPPSSDVLSSAVQSVDIESSGRKLFTADQRSNAINISRSLAMAYIMDQKAMLLQQSSWQNNVRMSSLVEQIRGPLSTIRTLSKMLSVHTKKSEIARDIVDDILVQGDQIKGTLEELQDAVHLTKANILRYNEETLKKMHDAHHESMRSHLSDTFSRENSSNNLQKFAERLSLGAGEKDLEMPMPPLTLAPLHNHAIRKTVQCF
ncbi:chloroplast sensor kinase, chloroplastic isoform X2 [Carica papaya]|uniref:chloroplast sensor kinase, chloroplastic isoform X2 n=1 Tax=Carica papaya TaxID=3649 RepID=UPI000B8CDDD0|nr:chloroplast sensor kinase, chloroplastic isoform X2 [Carica papaya]